MEEKVSKIIENLKSGNYEVVDNQGVSVTRHFTQCLEKEFADLEAKLKESEKLTERLQQIVDKLRDKEFAGKTLVEAVNAVYEPLYKNKYDEAEELKQQLHDLPKKIVEEIKDKIPEIGGMKCEIIIDDSLTLNTLLDTILKKYGEEDE